MRRGLYSLVAGALLVGVTGYADAQDAEAPAEAADAGFATVIGIAKGDLLNIRAAASATGMTIARVPNGTLLKVSGCDVVARNLWCKVEDAANATATGWTPARYLSGYEAQAIEAASTPAQSSDEGSIMSSDATFGVETAKPKRDVRERAVVASFHIEPIPADTPAAGSDDAPKAVRTVASPISPIDLGAPDTAVMPFIALPVMPGEGTDILLSPVP